MDGHSCLTHQVTCKVRNEPFFLCTDFDGEHPFMMHFTFDSGQTLWVSCLPDGDDATYEKPPKNAKKTAIEAVTDYLQLQQKQLSKRLALMNNTLELISDLEAERINKSG
jgi:hypothetical protein